MTAVAGVLLLAGAALVPGPPVAQAVAEAIRRALCIVAGDACAPRRPCLVAFDQRARREGLGIGLVDLARVRELQVERFSDGSAVVTRAAGGAVGASQGLGLRLWSVDADGKLSVAASLVPGRAWRLPAGADVAAFAGRLERGEPVGAPAEVVERARLTRGGELDALVAAGTVSRAAVLGRRRGRAGTTWVLALDDTVTATLFDGVTGLARATTLEYALDRSGRPRSATVRHAVRLGGRLREETMTADLTGTRAGDLAATLARLRAAARERTTWTVTRSGAEEAIEVALGARVGVERAWSRTQGRLVAAETRAPGGVWKSRAGCA